MHTGISPRKPLRGLEREPGIAIRRENRRQYALQ
jgi:hypothetical protein